MLGCSYSLTGNPKVLLSVAGVYDRRCKVVFVLAGGRADGLGGGIRHGRDSTPGFKRELRERVLPALGAGRSQACPDVECGR